MPFTNRFFARPEKNNPHSQKKHHKALPDSLHGFMEGPAVSAQESLDSKIRVGYVFANLPLGRQIVISKIVRLFIFLILFIEVRLWLFLGFPVLRPARPFLS